MKIKLILIAFIATLISNCGSNKELSTPVLLAESKAIDSLFIGLPLIGDYKSLLVCILDYPELLGKIPSDFGEEGVVRTLSIIDTEGNLKISKVVESITPELDSISISLLRGSNFELPANISGVEGEYIIEVLFPFYHSNPNEDEYKTWTQTPKEEKSFDAPPFPFGGYSALQRRVVYPELAREYEIEGKVEIKFFLDSKGEVGHFEIMNSLGYGLEDAAIRALRTIDWVPAEKDGKAIPFGVVVPVVFRLGFG